MKKIIIFLLFIVVLGGYYFFSNYQVFYNPFEIISNEDVAKNEQGICVAENRKLSESELVTRFLNNEFIYSSTVKYPLKEFDDPTFNEVGDMVEFCPYSDSCILKKIPAMTIMEYLQKYFSEGNLKEEFISSLKREGDYLNFSQSPLLFKAKNFQNKKLSFSFYSYVGLDGGTFYPNDCCKIISHQEFLENKIEDDDYQNSEIENNWKKEAGEVTYLISKLYFFH